jgi:hypothetical protein
MSVSFTVENTNEKKRKNISGYLLTNNQTAHAFIYAFKVTGDNIERVTGCKTGG